jgi:hypothetical protein
MLTYYKGRISDLEDSLRWKKDEKGALKPEAQIVLNKIDQFTACVNWLKEQEESQD